MQWETATPVGFPGMVCSLVLFYHLCVSRLTTGEFCQHHSLMHDAFPCFLYCRCTESCIIPIVCCPMGLSVIICSFIHSIILQCKPV